MRTFTFAAATLAGYSQALRLATKASHADLIFAEFEARYNKNYLSQDEREERKEQFLKKHEAITHLHPATSFVGDNWTNDRFDDEMEKMHGIDPNTHKKNQPHPQLSLSEIMRVEKDNRRLSQSEDVVNMTDPQLTFTYNGMVLEAKITDLGGEAITPDDNTTPNDNTTPDDNTPIYDSTDFPLPRCDSGVTTCDWRAMGAVSPVKNQGSCGSCWSFAAAALTEADYFIQNGPYAGSSTGFLDLSEQQDVDCIFGHGGCQGGNSYDSWGLHAEHSSQRQLWALEEDYPYKASFQGDNKQCSFDRGVYVDYYTYHEGAWEDTQLIKDRLLRGPVVVYLWASDLVFTNYRGGVVTSDCTNSDINHAVLAVGFGHDETVGEDYFLVKNSWGSSWGEGGYIKIGHRPGNGVCGIQYWNHYQIETHSAVGL